MYNIEKAMEAAMENKITITEDLTTLFLALTLYEGYWNDIDKDNSKYRAQRKIERLVAKGHNIHDMVSMLTHFLLLYDKIETPNLRVEKLNTNSDITSIVEATNVPEWILKREQNKTYKQEFIPYELAINLKPLVINACMNNHPDDYCSKYSKDTVGSVENLYSYIYDRSYNQKFFKANDRIEHDLIRMFDSVALNLFNFDPNMECMYTVFNRVQDYLRYLLVIRYLAQEGPRDFYSPSFSNYHSSVNVNDAYCILKTQISMIMEEQPAFESLTDLLQFRKKERHGIELLRNEVAGLESLLKHDENEKAIQKAIDDVRKANQSLIKNSPAKSTARIATYLSVPLSITEMCLFGTSFSMFIGVVGTMAQLIVDSSDSKSEWLFVAR